METKDYITIISVVALIIGWFVNGILNRRNEIAKKRLEYRLPALGSFFLLVEYMQNTMNPHEFELVKRINKVGTDFHLYGQDDEIELFQKFSKHCQAGEQKEAREMINTLSSLVKSRIRKELNIK